MRLPSGQTALISCSGIEITTTEMPTGGERGWFLCPGCHRRCGRLYIAEELVRSLLCRVCVGAVYDVQYRKGMRGKVLRWVRKCVAECRNGLPTQPPATETIDPDVCPAEIRALLHELATK
jgi:hypothetical protein